MKAVGRFEPNILKRLKKDPSIIQTIIVRLLEDNFPESLHRDILQAIGISDVLKFNKTRDSSFRDRVLTTYSFKCAVCNFNVRLGSSLVALEAAHIKWHQAGGLMLRRMVWHFVHCIITYLIGEFILFQVI